MKNKKELIGYLEEKILETEKLGVLNEGLYRTFQAMVMASRKPDDETQGKLTSTKRSKDEIAVKLRQMRGLRDEIEKGTFEI